MKALTVITPVYEEADIIADFYAAVKSELEKLQGYSSEILFVVDRGRDATMQVLTGIAAKDPSVRVLGMSSRFGHQMSLLAGIDHAQSDVVIMMDSDLQHPPALIPEFIAAFEKGSEIVNATRDDIENVSFFKRASSHLFYSLMRRISEVPIGENVPDFRLISGRVARLIREEMRERNFFLRGIIPWMGFTQTTIRFRAGARRRGKTKYSFSRLMQLGIAGVVSFSRKPLRAILFLGLFLGGIAAVAILVMLALFFIYDQSSGVLAIGAGLLLLFFSVQCVVLGILGEYIGAIFDEVKERPRYIVAEKINF